LDVVLDLSGAAFMDCAGISAVVIARNQMAEDSKLVLRQAQPLIHEMLRILELDSVWVIESPTV
jgi:anti-anti-sigma factor